MCRLGLSETKLRFLCVVILVFVPRLCCAMENTSNQISNLSTEDCPLPLSHGVALITVNSIVGMFGTLGNLLVCVVVATNPRLRRASNFLLFSLAIADLIVTMMCEPVFVAYLGKRTFFNDCATNLNQAFIILTRLSCTASVVHMAAISVDRFIAVVYPLRYKSIINSSGLKILLITSWALPITVAISNVVIPANFHQAKAFLGLGVFGASYLTVFLFYSLIVISLVKRRKEKKKLRMHSSNNTSQQSVEIRVAFTLAVVIAVFTASWAPLVSTLFAAGKPMVEILGVAHLWIGTLALSNSAMNFVIYGSRMRNFRQAYAVYGRKLLDVLRPKCILERK